MTVSASLDRASYAAGEEMLLTVRYQVPAGSRLEFPGEIRIGNWAMPMVFEHAAYSLVVTDPNADWFTESDNGSVAVFSAVNRGSGTVEIMANFLGAWERVTVNYRQNIGFLLGMTAAPADTALTLSTFPGIRYMRDFGDDGSDADTETELTMQGAGKSALAGAGDVIFHNSWTDDVEQLELYLDAAYRRFFLSWRHEPHNRVTPTVFRATCERMVEILSAHPKRDLCLGNGPVLTRYWMNDAGGNPEDFWYDGATMFCVDAYNGTSTRYRTPEEMFGKAAQFASLKGVPWLASEWGAELVTGDTGTGRADLMERSVAWAKAEGNCLGMGWWNKGGDRITGKEPEQTTFRQLLAEQ